MDFNKALSIIRDKYKNRFIQYGFEYKNLFVFAICANETYIENDMAVLYATIDKNTNEIGSMNYFDEFINNPDEMELAEKKKIYVDLSKNKEPKAKASNS